jgi:hypothetical protein
MRCGRLIAIWVFLTLAGTYAYFWHARDWNVASRLMLTYALVDRGTVCINGLEDHTRDRARIGDRYYTDKLPGLSLLAVPPTFLAKLVLHIPDHPLGRSGRGFTHWPTDYWATLGTSGLFSALTGALLVLLAFDLGCGPRRAALVGLSYGLATPAYAYATLAYGHQATAFALLAAFALLWKAPQFSHPGLAVAIGGTSTAAAPVIELQVAPVAAILGSCLLIQVAGGRLPPRTLVAFACGALVPLAVLLVYNQAAFGTPWDMGYFHEDIAAFRQVHSTRNPLGLGWPKPQLVEPLLIGRYRGLFYYAPILLLAPLGWAVLLRRRRWVLATSSFAACVAVLLVNLSYPEWTGGWSTGPRLLTPLLPFAMVPVAGLMAAGWRGAVALAAGLALAGAILVLLFQGVGARVPHDIADPLGQYVLPAWSAGRLTRTLAAVVSPQSVRGLPRDLRYLQFVPLVLFQLLMVTGVGLLCRCRPERPQ